MAPPDEDVSAGSILRELIANQYQAIVLGGTAIASLITLNPLPLLLWLGSELVLLPILDSGPLRRLVSKRKREIAKAQAAAARAQLIRGLTPDAAGRYSTMEEHARSIETNYQSLTGISQAYLSEQRGKLDQILQGYLNRLMALHRYEQTPVTRSRAEVEREIKALEHEIAQPGLNERTCAALTRNLELKKKLLASLSEVGGTVKALSTELDSMEALLEVLHQNSISLRDPQAISEELDTIVRQSEDSEKIVREMEGLLRADNPWHDELSSAPPVPASPSRSSDSGAGRQKPKTR